MEKISIHFFSALIALMFVIYSCGKGGSGGGTPPNPCSSVSITVAGTTANPTTPAGSDGSINASATGGAGFTYSLNGAAFQSSGNFSGLAAGTYTITAKSDGGCTGSGSFTLTAPNPCTGVTITVAGTTTNPTTGTATDGSINATATGGGTGFTYSINGGAFQASGNFTGLAAGAYTITAKNNNGCTGSSPFTLTNPCTGVTITVTGTTTNPTAAGATNGSIAASATGGATAFTYNINGGTFQASGTFNNLGAGTYNIIAKNAAGCTGTSAFTLTAPNICSGVTINVNTTAAGNVPCQSTSGMITATATGGTNPYTFSINGTSFQSSNIFNNLVNGNYTITSKDANGCTGTSGSTSVSDLPAGPLFSAVRTLIQNNCVSCHNASVQNGGMNWTVDCNIVQFKDRIQARAVNGNPSPMPEGGLLPASERQKITDWINAGGKYSN